MNLKNKWTFFIILVFGSVFAFSQSEDFYVMLEEGVYGNTITLEESQNLYVAIQKNLRGNSNIQDTFYKKIMTEKLLGDIFLQNNDKENAKLHYEKGLEFAKEYLEREKNDYSHALVSLLISMNTQVNPFSYTLAHAVALEKNAKKSLELNERNPLGLFLYASRFIFAPPALGNVKKGIKILREYQDIVGSKAEILQIYHTLVKAYIKLEDYNSAKEFQQKCEDLFPQNIGVLETKALLEQKMSLRGTR